MHIDGKGSRFVRDLSKKEMMMIFINCNWVSTQWQWSNNGRPTSYGECTALNYLIILMTLIFGSNARGLEI
jgi:hypothetical protein